MFEYILDAGPGTIIQNGVFMRSRSEAVEAVRKGFQGVATVDRVFNQTQGTVLAPGVALLTGEGSTAITNGDERTFSRPFAVTEVFVL
jgi:hypothetical protein